MKITCHNTQYWVSSVLIFTLLAEWYLNKLSPISSDFHVSMVDTACFIKEKAGKSSVHMVLQILCFRVYQNWRTVPSTQYQQQRPWMMMFHVQLMYKPSVASQPGRELDICINCGWVVIRSVLHDVDPGTRHQATLAGARSSTNYSFCCLQRLASVL